MSAFGTIKNFVFKDDVYTIQQIKELLTPILDCYHIDKAWIFGSYARGEAIITSDVDVAVRVSDGFDSFEYLALFEPLMEVLGKRVDIYDIREFKDSNFMEGAIEIYAR